MCETWLIRVCDITLCTWQSSFMCVTWLICVAWLMHVCDVTHSYEWHDSSMCVARPIRVCDMTWHDSHTKNCRTVRDKRAHLRIACQDASKLSVWKSASSSSLMTPYDIINLKIQFVTNGYTRIMCTRRITIEFARRSARHSSCVTKYNMILIWYYTI